MVSALELFLLNTNASCDGQGGINDMSKCGCGRSPTGMCKGWHELTAEEFEAKLEKFKQENPEE